MASTPSGFYLLISEHAKLELRERISRRNGEPWWDRTTDLLIKSRSRGGFHSSSSILLQLTQGHLSACRMWRTGGSDALDLGPTEEPVRTHEERGQEHPVGGDTAEAAP